MGNVPTFIRKNAVPAVDLAGEIVQVGPSVPPDLHVGLAVCGTVPTLQISRGFGTLSEYVVMPASVLVKMPEGLDPGTATALAGIAGQTTAILLKTANVSKGDRVLVNGASGGVGCFVLQVLRAKGAHITALCSGRNEDMVRRLGADEVVDYTAHDSLYDHLSTKFKDSPFDTILDLVGNETLFKKSPGYLKPSGRCLDIAGSRLTGLKAKLPRILGGTARSFLHVDNAPSGILSQEAADWYSTGWVKDIPVDSTYDMDDVVEAYERLASKHAKGKIVIKVN